MPCPYPEPNETQQGFDYLSAIFVAESNPYGINMIHEAIRPAISASWRHSGLCLDSSQRIGETLVDTQRSTRVARFLHQLDTSSLTNLTYLALTFG